MKKILLTLVLTQTQAAVGSYTFYPPTFGNDFAENLKKRIRELEEIEREKQRKLSESNIISGDDYNKILEEKIKDLKSINAILIRFKEDFRKVREQNDQDGRFTKDKVNEIFKTNIWKYVPNKDLKDLVLHLHRDFHSADISRSEKLSQLRNKITVLKNQLIYLRDLCTRKESTPWKVFVYLYHTDIRLAVHKGNREWDEYVQVLKELDQGLN